jgi:uncharacterized membrane protein
LNFFDEVLVVKSARWLEIIVLFTLLTIAVVYVVSGDSPLFVLRYLLGFVFVVFMPGYCLVNILFTDPNRIDPVETAVLSVALSFGIAGLVGLFLGLSPIGIMFTPAVLSLTGITLILAVIAFVKKRKAPEPVQSQPVEQMP